MEPPATTSDRAGRAGVDAGAPPCPVTPLVGRAEDVARVAALVAGGARLVTLCGLGGVGKTRVGLAAVDALARAGGRVAWCDAAALQHRDELAGAMAAALGLGGRPDDAADDAPEDGAPPGLARRPTSPFDALAARLARGRTRGPVVLGLDNLEALVPSAQPELAALLARAPGLALVVTSRVALGLPGERVVQVEPLPVGPGPGAPACELLRARVADLGPLALPSWTTDPEAVAALAARLEGIPLALELAAARAHLVAPRELDALLAERSPDGRDAAAAAGFTLESASCGARQGSMPAVIGWAWAQLGQGAAELLAQLALIEGDCDLALAAGLLDVPRGEALSRLEVLVRYSLVTATRAGDDVRYRLLRAVRDFALDRLGPPARAACLDRVGRVLRARAGPIAGLAMPSPDAARWLDEAAPTCLAFVRRVAADRGAAALEVALHVGTALLVVTRTRALLARPVTEALASLLALLEPHAPPDGPAALAGAVDPAIGLTAALRLLMTRCTFERQPGRLADLEALVARLSQGASAALRLAAEVALGVAAAHRGEHAAVLARFAPLDALARAEGDARALQLVTDLRAHCRRELGQLTGAAADETLDALRGTSAQLASRGRLLEALSVEASRAILTVQLGRAELGEALAGTVSAAAGAARCDAIAAYTALYAAYARAERGDRRGALAVVDEVLARHAGSAASREWLEVMLDRASLALALGRYDEVARGLALAEPHLATAAERAYHHALAHARAALAGGPASGPASGAGPAPSAAPPPCDGVEAVTVALLLGIGEARDEPPASALEAALGQSHRARRALRLARAARALRVGEPGAVGVAPDGKACLVGGAWIDLAPRPLLAALLDVVAEAHLGGEPWVADRSALGQRLWPGERIEARARDQRLYALVTALRDKGLGDLVRVDRGRLALDPSAEVLRVAVAAWPGHAGFTAARGRGRPRARA